MGIDLSKGSTLNDLAAILFSSEYQYAEINRLLIEQKEEHREKVTALLKKVSSYQLISKLMVFLLINDRDKRGQWLELFNNELKSCPAPYCLGLIMALFQAGSQLNKDGGQAFSSKIISNIVYRLFHDNKIFEEIEREFYGDSGISEDPKEINAALTYAICNYCQLYAEHPDENQLRSVRELIFDLQKQQLLNPEKKLPKLVEFTIGRIFDTHVINLPWDEKIAMLSRHFQQ